MSRPVDAVIEYLQAESARGVTHVFLDQEARQDLRDLLKHAREGGERVFAPVVSPAEVAAAVPVPVSVPVSAPPPPLTIDGDSKTLQIESLRRQAETWAPAVNLNSLRKTLVFSTGNPDASIMLIGEAPGHEEERKGKPFVGPAGQKLNDILRAMGLSRDQVYVSNIVKFRPATPRQTTNNRKPTLEEIAIFLPFVRAEVGIVRPSCIIALGATAAEGLLGVGKSVADMRGAWHEFEGVPVRVSYHPSCLLRSDSDLTTKRALWEDMLAVMDRLEMPVTPKQRGFFQRKS